MAKEEVQIKELLGKLEKETDKKEKQKIRAQLRSLGHRGGLAKPKSKKKKAAKKKA